MVAVNHHNHLQAAGRYPCEQGFIDTFRQDHRYTAVQAQCSEVGDGRQVFGHAGKAGIGEGQRVAAAEDDFTHLLASGQVVQCGRPVFAGWIGFTVRVVATETVAAVYRAGTGQGQQYAAGIFMQQAGNRHGVPLLQRVAGVAGRYHQLLAERQHLPEQGVGGVAPTHALHEAGRHAQAELPGGLVCLRQQRARQIQASPQHLHVGDALAQQRLPGCRLSPLQASRYHTAPVFPDIDNTRCSMATYSTNEFKGGLKIMLDNDPCSIIENEFVKPGKGQAFNRVKIRNLKTGRVIERTFKSGETVEAADVMETDMQYLYSDGEFWHFMDPDSYEQIAAGEAAVADAKKWLKEQDTCVVTLWDGVPISVTTPNFVELEVTETDPGVRGDTSGGGGKPATLQTGAVVRVPLFIDIGEIIRVDTRTGEYVGRAKD